MPPTLAPMVDPARDDATGRTAVPARCMASPWGPVVADQVPRPGPLLAARAGRAAQPLVRPDLGRLLQRAAARLRRPASGWMNAGPIRASGETPGASDREDSAGTGAGGRRGGQHGRDLGAGARRGAGGMRPGRRGAAGRARAPGSQRAGGACRRLVASGEREAETEDTPRPGLPLLVPAGRRCHPVPSGLRAELVLAAEDQLQVLLRVHLVVSFLPGASSRVTTECAPGRSGSTVADGRDAWMNDDAARSHPT